MAGPGAVTATMLLAGRAGGDLRALGSLIAVAAAAILVCLGAFLAAERVARLLGVTGNVVLTRMFGLVLAALRCNR